MSNFLTRTLSGAVYVGLVVASILVHPVFFGIVFLLVTVLAVREFHVLMHTPRLLNLSAMLMSGLLFAGSWLLALHTSPEYVEYSFAAFITTMVMLLLTLVAVLFVHFKESDAIRCWGNILGSLTMIAIPFMTMNGVLVISKYQLLALFITIWVNDSGAYCVGSLTAKRPSGNHKMFPRVSPAKSWEGLFGGIFFALIAGIVYWQVGWFLYAWQSLVFALLIAVFGTLGDLMESLMKRTIGVKDSGRFLPGHGGVLDRFDSILLATPVVYLYLVILRLM